MGQYIDKSAVVAEIEKRIDRDNEMAASYSSNSEHDYLCRVKEKVYKSLLSFLDTLEVKGVDLEEKATPEETLKDYAYQVAYDLSNDWLEDNATWDDVETAVKLGAQWQKQQLIDKACDWLSLDMKMLMNVLDVEYDTHDIDIKDFIEDFKNHMKG